MKKVGTGLLLLFVLLQLNAQTIKIRYEESDEDIRNPERGFYIPLGTRASDFKLLDKTKLQELYSQPFKAKSASYSVNLSLIYRSYELDTFKDKPLSAGFLESIQKDFDAVRETGFKVVLRFAYINSSHGGDCKDEYKICPPYGDAPKQIVFNHIKQLKPLLQKNADVIAVLQEGFIGIWGENYFTDHFGCASEDDAGKIHDSSWLDRNRLLKYLLDAMPTGRMVQVRTPQIKQRYVYGARAKVNSAALTLKEAFNKTAKARIGFHNDCFLASTDDYGTFNDYGNSVTTRDTANFRLRKYFESDSKYTAVGGETCDDRYSPQNDCEPVGHAETELRLMHYSYLNASYNNKVNNDWDSLGCMKSIKQKLGYRFILKSASFSKTIQKGKAFFVLLQIENAGYASPYNPRPVQLIVRNKHTQQATVFNFKTSIQKWFPGKIQLQQKFILPAALPNGVYELLLNLPDGYKSLQGNPAYSIQFANEDMWEAKSGFNDLQHTFILK